MNFIGFHNLCVVLDDRKFGVFGFNNDMFNVLREIAENAMNHVNRNDVCIHVNGMFGTPKAETIICVNKNIRVMMKVKPFGIECSKMSSENISDFKVIHVDVNIKIYRISFEKTKSLEHRVKKYTAPPAVRNDLRCD
jgi:hypothetical protein